MRKALLIGINYFGTGSQLAGCINDVRSMEVLLGETGYSCTLMTDELSKTSPLYPTRTNILAQLTSFVRSATNGDKLFLHYSGHGTSISDRSGDESDRMDEAICPVSGSVIVDDELRQIVVDQLPQGCSLIMLLDCCHSGTGADLRFNYEDRSRYIGSGRMPDEYVAKQWRHNHDRRINMQCKETQNSIICISGCRDNQTSADTVFNNKPCGAMTEAFLRAYRGLKRKNNEANLRDIMQFMTGLLRCYRYEQIPQLSLSSVENDSQYALYRMTMKL